MWGELFQTMQEEADKAGADVNERRAAYLQGASHAEPIKTTAPTGPRDVGATEGGARDGDAG